MMATHTPPSHFIALRDGRRLAYSLFGHPSPSSPTILYHHGFASSRLEPALLHAPAADLGLRIVAFDRPGCGRSSHDGGRTVESVAEDVHELMEALGLEEPVVMMGASGGAPYAAACAAQLPTKVQSLLLLVPFAPIGGRESQLTAGMSPSSKKFLAHAVHRPWRLWFLLHLSRLLQYVPHGTILLRRGGFSAVDIAAAQVYPDQAAALRRASKEGLRKGVAGAMRDLQRMTARGMDVSCIRQRCVVWAGAEDAVTPPAMAEFYGAAIPRCEVHLVPGAGHFLGFGRGREVLQSIVAPKM